MNIAENIKTQREKAGMTQTQLADAVSVGQAMICKIENGIKSLSLPLSAAIAKVLGCSIDDFVK